LKLRTVFRKSSILILLWLFLFSPLTSQIGEDSVIISMAKTARNLNILKGMALDFLMERNNRIFVHVRPKDLATINSAGLVFTEEHMMSPSEAVGHEAHTTTSINGAFHSYAELEADLLALESDHPEIVRVHVIGQSVENRNLYAVKISDNVDWNENEAEVLFLGCHHAREWISVEVPFLIARHLAVNYVSDAEIKRMVDHSEIWIVPLINPDGLEYSIHFYRYWRKNRKNNGDGSYGVDLNRNYGYQWGCDDEGSSPDPSSFVFRGESPFSEAETKAVRDFMSQKSFRALVSYHSYSQIILYPWGYTEDPTEDDALLSGIAHEMSNRMRPANNRVYLYGNAGDSLYLTNGDTTDWAYGTFGIPSFTIELPPVDEIHGGFFNSEQDIQSIFIENLPGALFLIDWSIAGWTEKLRRQIGPQGPEQNHNPEKNARRYRR